MATTTVTPTRLTNAFSADILVTDGITATSQTDGWAIALGSRGTTEQLLVVLLDDGSGANLTVKAGDRSPGPAQLAGKGDLTKVMAASDCFWYCPEPGRFEQDNNTIQIVSDDAGTKCIAFLLPVGYEGGSAIA